MRVVINDSAAPPVEDGDVRVNYVPAPVEARIREMSPPTSAARRARKGGRIQQLAGLVKKLSIFGDLRTRAEGIYYPSGNDNTGHSRTSTRSTPALPTTFPRFPRPTMPASER